MTKIQQSRETYFRQHFDHHHQLINLLFISSVHFQEKLITCTKNIKMSVAEKRKRIMKGLLGYKQI